MNSTNVLLVEDNPIDVRLIRYALQQERAWETQITVAEDGEKAINLLVLAAASLNPEDPISSSWISICPAGTAPKYFRRFAASKNCKVCRWPSLARRPWT